MIFWYTVMLPLSLVGHTIGLTPSWHELNHHGHAWMPTHYPLVRLRYIATAVLMIMGAIGMRSEHKKRKASPPRAPATGSADAAPLAARAPVTPQATHGAPSPDATMSGVPRQRSSAGARAAPLIPERFTQEWIAETVPHLRSQALCAVIGEMRRSGWSTADIQHRVWPYVTDDPGPARQHPASARSH